MPTVLIVDDEREIVDLLQDYLRADGFEVMGAYDGETAIRIARQGGIDCLILDIMMPGPNGLEVCRQLRTEGEVPIIFLSARQTDVDKIRGLGIGADDYVGKPFSPGEVVARVKSVLRRYQKGQKPTPSARLSFGHVTIDLRAREVFIGERPVTLTPKEYDLLLFLAEHPRQVFTREQLFDRIWGDFGDLHTVTVHIGRIREKIEADPTQPAYITTVWGVGYRFEGERR